jgi:hypothetical protein
VDFHNLHPGAFVKKNKAHPQFCVNGVREGEWGNITRTDSYDVFFYSIAVNVFKQSG